MTLSVVNCLFIKAKNKEKRGGKMLHTSNSSIIAVCMVLLFLHHILMLLYSLGHLEGNIVIIYEIKESDMQQYSSWCISYHISNTKIVKS